MPLFNNTLTSADSISTEWAPNARIADDAMRTIVVQAATVLIQAVGTRTTLPTFSTIEAASWRIVGQEAYGTFTPLSLRMKGVHIVQAGAYYECLTTGTTLASFALDAANWQSLGGGGTTEQIYTQVAHGFIVGNALYHSLTAWALGKADAVGTSDIVGIVSRIVDVDNFALETEGPIIGLAGLVIGSQYFLSATVAGLATITEPSTVGHVSKPLFVADTATTAVVNIMRGAVIGTAATGLAYNVAIAYVSGAQVVRRGVVIQANAAIPANTAFSWGTVGATWKPVLDTGMNWLGVWSSATTYAIGDVVAYHLATSANLLHATVPGINRDPGNGLNGAYWRDFLSVDTDVFVGATTTAGSSVGLVPQASAALNDALLHGDGNWSSLRLKTRDVTDRATGGEIAVGGSIANPCYQDQYVITQLTSGQTLTLAAPAFATSTSGRSVWIKSSASSVASFILYGKTIAPDDIVQLLWDISTSTWEVVTGTPVALNWNIATAYLSGAQVVRRGVVIQANAAIPANTAFAWGATGATWKPVLDTGLSWAGIWGNVTAYTSNDVVAYTAVSNQLYRSVIPGTAKDPGAGGNGSYWEDFLSVDVDTFRGATLNTGGSKGLVPPPGAGVTDSLLHSDNIWSGARLKSYNSADLPTGGDIDTGSTITNPSNTDQFIVTQVTANQVLTLGAPIYGGTPNFPGRVCFVSNAVLSTEAFTIYGEILFPGESVQLLWNNTIATWIPLNGTYANSILNVSADTSLDTTSWNSTIYASGACVITLPTAIGFLGQKITVKRVASTSGIVEFAGFGAQTIDGGSNAVTKLVFNQAVTFESDGLNVFTVNKFDDTGAQAFVGNSQPDPTKSRRAIIAATGAGPYSVLNPTAFSSESFPFVTQFRNSTATAKTFNFGSAWIGRDGNTKNALIIPAFSYRMMLWSSDLSTNQMNILADSSDNDALVVFTWVAAKEVSQGELRTVSTHGATVYIKSTANRTTGAGLDGAELANWEYAAQSTQGAFVANDPVIVGQKVLSGSLIYQSIASRNTAATFNDAEKAFWIVLNPSRSEVRTVTANYVAQEWDEIILVDSTAGSVTVTIPVTLSQGKKITVHKLVSANSMIVASTSLVLTSFAVGTTESFATQYTNIPYFVASGTVRIYA